MKKVIFLFCLLIFVVSQSNSQSFIFKRVSPQIVYGDTSWMYPTILKAVLKNTSASTQNFKIVRVAKSFPTGWQLSLCTYLNCFGDIDTIPPAGSGNYPLSANQADTITIDIYGATVGSGWVIYRTFIVGNPTAYQQDTFRLQLGPVGITPISSIVKDYELKQNYPNPFNPSTSIEFSLQKNSDVNLIIYNMQGKEVARLLNNVKLGQGSYKYDFDSKDFNLSSGVYFYKLITGDYISVKKMMLIK